MTSEVPIQVAIRIRPLLGNEVNKDPCLYCIPDKPVIVLGNSKNFTFDQIFAQPTSQKVVYASCVRPLISLYFEGYNTTVFAYGQTGSGKTYTMATGNRCYLNEDECGIIPRAVNDIFERIEKMSDRCVCNLRISFIEVYKEECKDLLGHSSSNVQIMDDENGNTVVMGVQEEVASTVDEVLHLLDAGTAMRHVGSTNMNEQSSRSHCIFTLILDQYPTDERAEGQKEKRGNVLSSRFHFVDLAGSERAQRTGNRGERFKESISINTGLLALGNVISALAERRKDKHVPYRESKLTRLLKDSLGGNSRTLMITCLSPALADLDENLNSLKYAERAKRIRNTPVVNFDLESSKISQMKTEIEVLRDQLQRKQSSFLHIPAGEVKKMNELEVENEKREVEQNFYLQQLHEVNIILQGVEQVVTLPATLKENLDLWRKTWEKYHFGRPITAPTRGSALRRPQNDILKNIRTELSSSKTECRNQKDLLEVKERVINEMREEMEQLQEENLRAREEMEEERKLVSECQDKMMQLQVEIQNLRNAAAASCCMVEGDHAGSPSNEMMQNFRARSELLISRINDLDRVEYDDNLSSDDDEQEVVLAHWNRKTDSSHGLTNAKTFVSQIPRPSRSGRRPESAGTALNGDVRQEHVVNGNGCHKDGNDNDSDDPFEQLKSERICAQEGARAAEMNVREVSNRMKELEQNIQLKENLIEDLIKSEKEARATSSTFRMRFTKLEKEYEQSKIELEEAKDKVNKFENSSNKGDPSLKTKLEIDYKKKIKDMEKKYNELKQKENVSNRVTTFSENKEKKVKDMEAHIGRMRNNHIELDRKLKEESDKKSKYEQELTKYELRIKELELKMEQQQKVLKRKNEEVVAAQRKLRIHPESSKFTDALEQKKQWVDAEMDKIMARQRDMEALEAELQERDESLKKKELLMREKDQLEDKRARSSQSLSRSIMQLSLQVESVDEKIQLLSVDKKKFSQDLQQLQRVKQDLTSQQTLLERSAENGGLDNNEKRRLIELGEAVEAVDEAIQFKNELIAEKQTTIEHDGTTYAAHIDGILDKMGDLTPEEYKHLLGKQLSKIIHLRKTTKASDDARQENDVKITEHERKVYDMQRMLQVTETRYEKMILEQNRKYEKDIQFLMEQLRLTESSTTREENETRVVELEKELCYYKSKTRKLKDQILESKDRRENKSRDSTVERKDSQDAQEKKTNSSHGSDRKPVNGNRESTRESTRSGGGGGGGAEGDFHLPNIRSHHLLVKKDSEKKLVDHHTNVEEAKRLQEIFDSKTPQTPASRSSSKRSSVKKKSSKDDLLPQQRSSNTSSVHPDSMEVCGENPWAH